MAEIITIETRRISGTGLILPSSADMNYRRYTLFADIIRKPRTPYLSRESDPPETYYGVISLMKDDYVVQTYKIRFDAQIWTFDADITGQVINTIKCVYDGILVSFENLGTALDLTVTSVENEVTGWKNLPLQWDSIRVKCFADCAIQLVLKGLKYDFCEPDDEIPGEPPPPPEKPETVAPGVGTDISLPYDDDPITDPAQIDKEFEPPAPPPIGEPACSRWMIVFTASHPGLGTTTDQRSCWGRTGGIYLEETGGPTFYSLSLKCGGQSPPQVSSVCDPTGNSSIGLFGGFLGPFTSYSIVSAVRLDV